MRTSSLLALAVAVLLSVACGRTSTGRVQLDAGNRDTGVGDVRETPAADAFVSQRDAATAIDAKIGDNAIAQAVCAPNDGAAVAIHIGVDQPSCDSGASGPGLVVTLYDGWDYLRPGTYELDTNAWIGTAAYSPTQGQYDWETATRSVLTIVSIDAVRMVAHCESTFPSGSIAVDFVATWCGGYPLCG
jgi:hypothetical protein